MNISFPDAFMPKRRPIYKNLNKKEKNFYIVDANFLANKYLPLKIVPKEKEDDRERIKNCKEWWKIIEKQIKAKQAIVYIPDICIAEVIKVFAKTYYRKKWFTTSQQYNSCIKRFLKDIRTSHKELASKNRHIRYHDISTSRDILISVERFNRIFISHGYHGVSVPDLIIVSTAKYLMDFYNVPYKYIHILTTDNDLKAGSNKVAEIPTAYDPAVQKVDSIFK